MIRAKIAGVGAYAPDRVVTNSDLERIVGTRDEWIVQRTGIREGRIADDGDATPGARGRTQAQGRLRPGDLVLMAAFGGGFTWGAALIQWS